LNQSIILLIKVHLLYLIDLSGETILIRYEILKNTILFYKIRTSIICSFWNILSVVNHELYDTWIQDIQCQTFWNAENKWNL